MGEFGVSGQFKAFLGVQSFHRHVFFVFLDAKKQSAIQEMREVVAFVKNRTLSQDFVICFSSGAFLFFIVCFFLILIFSVCLFRSLHLLGFCIHSFTNVVYLQWCEDDEGISVHLQCFLTFRSCSKFSQLGSHFIRLILFTPPCPNCVSFAQNRTATSVWCL